jgi:hypothetical protein
VLFIQKFFIVPLSFTSEVLQNEDVHILLFLAGRGWWTCLRTSGRRPSTPSRYPTSSTTSTQISCQTWRTWTFREGGRMLSVKFQKNSFADTSCTVCVADAGPHLFGRPKSGSASNCKAGSEFAPN